MKKVILIFIAIFSIGNTIAQSTPKKAEIVINTSAECGTCKKILEEKLNYTKGIKYAELDVSSKNITVGYTPKKINADEIKKIISETGYDADDVPANRNAQNTLPTCCQPGGMTK